MKQNIMLINMCMFAGQRVFVLIHIMGSWIMLVSY